MNKQLTSSQDLPCSIIPDVRGGDQGETPATIGMRLRRWGRREGVARPEDRPHRRRVFRRSPPPTSSARRPPGRAPGRLFVLYASHCPDIPNAGQFLQNFSDHPDPLTACRLGRACVEKWTPRPRRRQRPLRLHFPPETRRIKSALRRNRAHLLGQ